MSFKSWVKKHIPQKYIFPLLHVKKKFSLQGGALRSFSGSGEDILLTEYLFKDQKKGFYVDVGAFHPTLLSNTHLLHKRGWCGINIDPNPTSIKYFKKARPQDTNLEVGVSLDNEQRTYYDFAYSGVNTLDKGEAKKKSEKDWNTLVGTKEVNCRPLAEICDEYVPQSTKIDVLDVDVEGLDFEVLKSHDWENYGPSVVLVEDKSFKSEFNNSEIYRFLTRKGYEFYSYTKITLIMVLKS